MTDYRITYKDESAISEILKYGEMTYDSTVMKMIWLKTSVDIKVLENIEGVCKVEDYRKNS